MVPLMINKFENTEKKKILDRKKQQTKNYNFLFHW